MKTQYIEKTDALTRYFSDKEMTILHREDGAAVEHTDGTKSWYKNGELLSEKEFDKRMNPDCNGKIITIDGIEYKLEKA